MTLRNLCMAGTIAMMVAAAPAAAQSAGATHEHERQSNSGSGMSHMMMIQNDQQYVQMMLMHHEQGIKMAQAENDKGQRSEVKQLASEILTGQEQEKKELESFNGDTTSGTSGTSGGGHNMSGMGHMDMMKDMPQMKQGEDAVPRMQNASGADADRIFLASMIKHHEMAIQMSEQAKPKLKDATIRAFADKTIANQRKEVAELKKLQGS